MEEAANIHEALQPRWLSVGMKVAGMVMLCGNEDMLMEPY